jgi:hypothetical protein
VLVRCRIRTRKSGVSLNTVLRAERHAGLWARCVPVGFALMLVAAELAGCSNHPQPTVNSIHFVDATGTPVSAVTMLPVNQPVYLYATVANDDDLLGVTWDVTCLSAALPVSGVATSTACGVVSPAQTASGPIPTYPSTGIITTYTAPSAIPKGGTVTIIAHATSLPSAFRSVTLTIVDAPSTSSSIDSP